MPSLLSKQALLSTQENDREIQEVIKYLKQGKRDFPVQQFGTLKRFRKQLQLDTNGLLLWKTKTLIPTQLRPEILRLCHDHPLSGHFGVDCTWSQVSAHYFWPRAKDFIDNWVSSCQKCAEFNTPSQGYVNTPLMPIETSSRFDMICYDLAGPFLPKTARGHVYALIIVDHFIKWPEIVPLPDCNASTIAQAIFDNWVCRYGIMNRLQSDGAHNVDGEVMRQVSQLMDIHKSHSS